ncbi:hypothetical protein [Williamsia sp. CHRR-6]|uniref:hypothetical protein n=1 Tax=Williamsia sp. CHRR-6 TaxID=2835871 RepID=UPI001BD952AB|nr:hypothetical protein [Williamsia sp. CHRR-6]MBT0566856.1 hypothetical protein [Williamsia sp. CHRR-6]
MTARTRIAATAAAAGCTVAAVVGLIAPTTATAETGGPGTYLGGCNVLWTNPNDPSPFARGYGSVHFYQAEPGAVRSLFTGNPQTTTGYQLHPKVAGVNKADGVLAETYYGGFDVTGQSAEIEMSPNVFTQAGTIEMTFTLRAEGFTRTVTSCTTSIVVR